MTEHELQTLQAILLAADGAGTFASLALASYFRWGFDYPRVRGLYIYFATLAFVFGFLTISDVMVVTRTPDWWATLPIVRGLVFRVPLALIQLWLVWRLYGQREGKEFE